MVDQDDVDRLGRIPDLRDRIAQPVDARHPIAVEAHFFEQGARQAVHDVALDGVAQPFRIDDQAAVVRDGDPPRPDPPGLLLDLDVGDRRDDRAAALGVGEAASAQYVAGASRTPVRGCQPAFSAAALITAASRAR